MCGHGRGEGSHLLMERQTSRGQGIMMHVMSKYAYLVKTISMDKEEYKRIFAGTVEQSAGPLKHSARDVHQLWLRLRNKSEEAPCEYSFCTRM